MSKILVPFHITNYAGSLGTVQSNFKKFYLSNGYFKLFDGASVSDVVLDRPLDGFLPIAGTITSSDTVLTALEKLQNAISVIGPGLIGPGTTKRIAKFSSPTTINNSIIEDTGSSIIIGRTDNSTSSYKLDVNGSIYIEGDARITGAVYDSNNYSGTLGQVLSSTLNGTEWIDNAGGGGGGTLDEVLTLGNTSDKSIILNHIPGIHEIEPLPWISTLNGKWLNIDWSSTVNDNYYSSTYRGNILEFTGYDNSADKSSTISLNEWSIQYVDDVSNFRVEVQPFGIYINNNITQEFLQLVSNRITFVKPVSGSAVEVTLISPNKPTGTYVIATTDDIPIVGDYVPYTGATEDVNLGVNDLTAQHLIKNGGVSTQFLKADGSVDNNIYLTSNDLPSTLDLFATTASSDILGYVVLVRNVVDPRFNTTAVNVSTGAITTTNQLLSSLVTDANVISGNPGVFNFTTIGNIRRVSGSGEAVFYFRIYKRDISGTETFITQSDNTIPVIDGGTYVEFSAIALWNDGVFLDTDRIVLKYYANRISGGSNPTYEFQFGGLTPVRSTAAIPIAVLPNIYLKDLADVENVDPLDNEILYWNDADSLWEHSSVIDLLPVFAAGSVLFSNGTTIAENNSQFFWDDTNNRLGISTNAPTAKLHVSGTVTAASAIARGQYLAPTLVASANSDVLVGLDINPTFTTGSFSGITSAAIRLSNNTPIIGLGSSGTNLPLISTTGTGTVIIGGTFPSTPGIRIQGSNIVFANASTTFGAFFTGTGNLALQNGGVFTDDGVNRLQVSGSARITNNIRVSGAFYDSSNSPGTNGTVLTSVASGTATQWTGVTGTGFGLTVAMTLGLQNIF